MPESPPPFAEGDQRAESGWYPDPQASKVLRWWDGDAWSEDAVKPAGEDGYPWWHPEFLRERARLALEECVVCIATRAWRG